MRKITNYLLSLMAVAGVMMLTSCGEDEETPTAVPTLTLSIENPKTSYEVNEQVTIKADFTAAANLVAMSYVAIVDGTAGQRTIVDLNQAGLANATTGSQSFNFTFNDSFAGKTFDIEFEIEDGEGRTAKDDVEVTIVESLNVFSAILLAAPIQDGGGTSASKTSETFFSTSNGTKYTMAQILASNQPLSANIDFGYFYGTGAAGFQATLASPAQYPFAYGQANWGTRNDTKIRRTNLSVAQFNEATKASITAAYNAAQPGTNAGQERNLTANTVLAFETDSNKTGGAKKGLILVKTITGTDGANGRIEFDVVVEK